MSDDKGVSETAVRLRKLIESVELSRADGQLAERCLRRLEQPLRLTVFGTSPAHAISLVNLMIGKPIVSPSISRARIQLLHSEKDYARVQLRDGSQKRIEGSNFSDLFEDRPSKVRICTDLPVLKKLSILVATEKNAKSLCADAEKTIPASDIALWAGNAFTSPMDEVWQNVPDRLRDHSYLVLSPEMESDTWAEVADEFAGVLQVDPIRAQEAKAAQGGIDKAAFKAAGGAGIVKTIKHELDVLVQSALDAGEVLLMRYADELKKTETPKAPVRAKKEPIETESEADTDAARLTEDTFANDDAFQTENQEEASARVLSDPMHGRVFSVPLGKLNSRSRMLREAEAEGRPVLTKRTVSLALKNMPKNTSRPASRVRTKSRPTRPAATPWSLGLD